MPKRTRETPLTGKTKDGEITSQSEESFCLLYVQELGNGVQAALASYGTDEKPISYRTASAIACENLKKPRLLKRIRELLDTGPLSDESVDAELSFLVTQSADLGAKKGGIDIFNKIKGRYEKDNSQKQVSVINVIKYGDNDSL